LGSGFFSSFFGSGSGFFSCFGSGSGSGFFSPFSFFSSFFVWGFTESKRLCFKALFNSSSSIIAIFLFSSSNSKDF